MQYIVTNYGPNRAQRNAAIYGDKTSGTPNRSKAGKRMRDSAGARLDSLMRGRDKINALYVRAGIELEL